jgi:hypothetical protein
MKKVLLVVGVLVVVDAVAVGVELLGQAAGQGGH